MSVITQRNEKLARKVVKNLEKRHFEAYYVKSKAEALDLFFQLVEKEEVVSWGGSQTMTEVGIVPALYERGYQVIDRDTGANIQERVALMRQALLSDVFVMSANAISEDGQLVNVDGNGNRVAALAYGPKKVIFLVGMNKIVRGLEDAITRARTIAAPINAQRFDVNTPCLLTGSCGDCISEDSICGQIVTTRISRPKHRIKVILIEDILGF